MKTQLESATTMERSPFFKALRSLTGTDVLPFSCGRAAMVMGLRSLGFGRMDEILVPPFLCHSVLSALGRTAFPTMTPSRRTKGILVFHQFGFPQDLAAVGRLAQQNHWTIVNDCAHTIFSQFQGQPVIRWGDFTVLSFSKVFSCLLGGGFCTGNDDLGHLIAANVEQFAGSHAHRASMAYEMIKKTRMTPDYPEAHFEIDAVYGYLPETVAFPGEALGELPTTASWIAADTDRRRKVWNVVQAILPQNVPQCLECEIAPFAVPIFLGVDETRLRECSVKIKDVYGRDVPILHFDFARNMLQPDYRKCLVLSCDPGWDEDRVVRICETIRAETL